MKITSQIFLSAFVLMQLSCFTSKITAQKNNKIKVYTTAENTNLKLSLSNDLISKNNTQQQKTSIVSILVNTDKTDQTFLGIGGAITDASAEVFAKLSPKKQQEFLAGILKCLLR